MLFVSFSFSSSAPRSWNTTGAEIHAERQLNSAQPDAARKLLVPMGLRSRPESIAHSSRCQPYACHARLLPCFQSPVIVSGCAAAQPENYQKKAKSRKVTRKTEKVESPEKSKSDQKNEKSRKVPKSRKVTRKTKSPLKSPGKRKVPKSRKVTRKTEKSLKVEK